MATVAAKERTAVVAAPAAKTEQRDALPQGLTTALFDNSRLEIRTLLGGKPQKVLDMALFEACSNGCTEKTIRFIIEECKANPRAVINGRTIADESAAWQNGHGIEVAASYGLSFDRALYDARRLHHGAVEKVLVDLGAHIPAGVSRIEMRH